jgi:hypothetical protein
MSVNQENGTSFTNNHVFNDSLVYDLPAASIVTAGSATSSRATLRGFQHQKWSHKSF